MEEEGDEAVSRLTLQDIQGGLDGGDDENFDMEMGHNDSSDAAAVAPAVVACTSFSPFASPAMQVRKSLSPMFCTAGCSLCNASVLDAGGSKAVGMSWPTCVSRRYSAVA